MLNFVMLTVIMLSVVMLSVVMLSDIILIVVAPFEEDCNGGRKSKCSPNGFSVFRPNFIKRFTNVIFERS